MSYEDDNSSRRYGTGQRDDNTYGSSGRAGLNEDEYSGARSGNTGTGNFDETDSYGSKKTSGYGRENVGGNRTGYDDSSYGDRTSGGLGTDDTYGRDSGRTGGADTGRDTYGLGSGRTNDDPKGHNTSSGNYKSSSRQGYGDDSSYNDRTSGGLGADDSYGDSSRTGGADTGRQNYGVGSGRTTDQEGYSSSRRNEYNDDADTSKAGRFTRDEQTSGGLGADDTYGDSTQTGGYGTNNDNYGLGTSRTAKQEGLTGRRNEYDDDNDDSRGSKGGDSTTGKLMEKAGSLLKNRGMQEKGAEKRREAADDY